jgi:hypothetical protein
VCRVVFPAPPSAAFCPAAEEAFPGALALAALDACPWALVHDVAQKACPLASSLFLRLRLVAACTVFPGRRAAWDALAALDAVLRFVARFPVSSLEPVRDSPLAKAEQAQLYVPQARLAPQPPGAPQFALPPALLIVLPWVSLSAVPLSMVDESESPRALSSLVHPV